MLSADLLLKGLGGLAVVGGATTVGVCYQQEKWIFAKKKVETLNLEKLAEKVGLSCKETETTPTATAGVECSKKEGTNLKISVKRDSKFEIDSLGSTGKIKVYKTSTGETYNNDFKFVIEEADVGSDNKKLEEFETYEIKKEGDVWSLTRKDKASVLKSKLLGLSGISNCKLPEEGNETTCSNLTAEDLKKIKFDGKKEDGTVTIEPTEGDNSITLKISKATDAPFNEGGYKFVLETNKNISVPKSSGAITIKKGTNTEFKLKATPKSGSPKTLTLEKAWTLDTLRAKVGIGACTAASGGGSGKECSFESAKVNLFIDASNHTKGASVKSNEGSTKKIKVEEDQEGHNQGFKFFTEEENGITLENGTPTGNGDKKIEKKDTSKNTPTYEIKQQTVGGDGTKDWYLSKVTGAK